MAKKAPTNTATTKAAPSALKPSKKKAAQARDMGPVIYPSVEVNLCLGDQAITPAVAKELLGWEEVKDANYHFKDLEGNSVRLRKNEHNRPLEMGTVEKYSQDLLDGFWADSRNGEELVLALADGSSQAFMDATFNGETVIIGRHGNVVSGQHRLIALVFAEQRRAKDAKEDEHYKARWASGPVTMEALVVYGISEHPKTVRTLDNVRPRTVADSMYAEGKFAGFKDDVRRDLCNSAMFAVRCLWRRAGGRNDAYSPELTNCHASEFMNSHPHVEQAVVHCFQENGTDPKDTGKIKPLVPIGTAAGLLWLMGSGSTPSPDVGQRAKYNAEEKGLDWSDWDKAVEFWTDLAASAKGKSKLTAVREQIAAVKTQFGADACSASERIGIIVKAWLLYRKGDPITAEDLAMPYTLDEEEDGTKTRVLGRLPTVEYKDAKDQWHGLDVGDKDLTPEAGDDEAPDRDEPDANGQQEAAENADRERRVKEVGEEQRSARKVLADIREDRPGEQLLFVGTHNAMAFGSDAQQFGRVLKLSVPDRGPDTQLAFPTSALQPMVKKLHEGLLRPVLVEKVDGAWLAAPDKLTSPKAAEVEGNGEATTPAPKKAATKPPGSAPTPLSGKKKASPSK